MALGKKVAGAITFWTHPYSRRTGILAATVTWGGSMAVIGLVFFILVCTGTFPGHGLAPPGSSAFTSYIVKYILYMLSGALAFVGVLAARGALASSRKTRAAKLILGVGMLCVLASAAMTIASLARSASKGGAHAPPVYVYIIEVLVVLIRLLFASILALAIWTLCEADKDPSIADMVLTGCGSSPAGQLPVSTKITFDSPYTSQPASMYAAPPPAAMGPYNMQQQQQQQPAKPGSMAPASPPAAALYPMPMQHQPVYPPQSAGQEQQQPVVWGSPAPVAAAVAPAPAADPVSSYFAYKQQRREERRQKRGLARFM